MAGAFKIHHARAYTALNTLTLSASAYTTASTAGTVIGAIQGLTTGSTVAISPADTRVAISGSNLVVGSTSSSIGTVSITLVETRAGSPGSPKPTSFSLTVTGTQQSVGNDGTGSFPVGATATTTANFAAHLTAAVAGDTLALAAGDYTTLMSTLSSINKGTGAGVTIQGQTGVTCRNISISSCVGLHFKYITLASTTATPSNMDTCDHCSYDHLTLTQGVLTANRSTGIGILSSTNCTATSNDISQVDNGIIVAGGSAASGASRTNCTDITIGGAGVGNRIQDFLGNALFFQVGTRLYGGYNWMRNAGEDGHPDFFQLTEVDNGTAEYNYCDASIGLDAIQGIVFTERCNNLIVEHNCSFGTASNGTQLSEDNHVLLNDNFWQGTQENSSGSGQFNSGIVVRDACNDVTITNNWTNYVNVYNGSGVNTNMTVPSSGTGVNTIIASAATKSSTTTRDAWLALHPAVNHF